ncbi:hypothetical protein BDV27DRAFT_119605 [Aspergillus caelatus]|uniref:Uncharacterized protein n=1 Tax=Aspergillus caelatus TaxID=61420 RepID=A0A5N7AM21_9EURO|nr:uncharacterized protein BDV27DRAFT_119605 [Aspergillus caelatus]KAE8370296.1 hypothetical protein BDV27DRAFT_119605 [Aspergillus caelatus]
MKIMTRMEVISIYNHSLLWWNTLCRVTCLIHECSVHSIVHPFYKEISPGETIFVIEIRQH